MIELDTITITHGSVRTALVNGIALITSMDDYNNAVKNTIIHETDDNIGYLERELTVLDNKITYTVPFDVYNATQEQLVDYLVTGDVSLWLSKNEANELYRRLKNGN